MRWVSALGEDDDHCAPPAVWRGSTRPGGCAVKKKQRILELARRFSEQLSCDTNDARCISAFELEYYVVDLVGRECRGRIALAVASRRRGPRHASGRVQGLEEIGERIRD
eukprot:22272-Pyramimonas_sp.AAC.1